MGFAGERIDVCTQIFQGHVLPRATMVGPGAMGMFLGVHCPPHHNLQTAIMTSSSDAPEAARDYSETVQSLPQLSHHPQSCAKRSRGVGDRSGFALPPPVPSPRRDLGGKIEPFAAISHPSFSQERPGLSPFSSLHTGKVLQHVPRKELHPTQSFQQSPMAPLLLRCL